MLKAVLRGSYLCLRTFFLGSYPFLFLFKGKCWEIRRVIGWLFVQGGLGGLEKAVKTTKKACKTGKHVFNIPTFPYRTAYCNDGNLPW